MSHLTQQQRELAAIGASLASNCIPCIKYHIGKGRETGLTDEEIAEAIEIADAVRRTPAQKVQEAGRAALGFGSPRVANSLGETGCGGARNVSESSSASDSPCCGPGSDT